MRGWDEGVPYDQLFPSSGNPAEALVGGIPLLLHTIFVVTCLYLLQRRATTERKPLFYALYWFLVVNLAELFSHVVMRPFASGGDTGRFNQGMKLSPWFLIVAEQFFSQWPFTSFYLGSRRDLMLLRAEAQANTESSCGS